VVDGGGLAGETEVFLDFAGGGHDAAAGKFVLEEVEDLLLAGGEHAVHANTA
jgi:hypothetical protein